MNEREGLLTVRDVAKLLKMSARTVYKRQRELGGFKPAGIGCVRFDPEVINGILLGPRAETLAIPIQTRRDQIYRKRIQDQERFRRSGSGTSKGVKGRSTSDADPYGLLRLCSSISPICREKVR
jgi:hypothetical protein